MIICVVQICFLSIEYALGVVLGVGDRVVKELDGVFRFVEEFGILMGVNQKAGVDIVVLDVFIEQVWW